MVDAGRARAGAAAAHERLCFRRARWMRQPTVGAKRFRPAGFKLRQLAMAAALDNGSRSLVDWPAGVGQGVGQRRGSTSVAVSQMRLAGSRILSNVADPGQLQRYKTSSSQPHMGSLMYGSLWEPLRRS